MSTTSSTTPIKRTRALRVNNIPEEATIITIAKACEDFIRSIKSISIVKPRSENTRYAIIDFRTLEHCEEAKAIGSIKIDGTPYTLHYTRSKDTSSYTATASEDKLYVKYPEALNEDEVIRMLGDVTISKPENANNYFFAVCKDIDQQCELVKKLDKKPVMGGELTVKVAIDKVRSHRRLPITRKVGN